MSERRARPYTLPDGTPSYWDKNGTEPAKKSIKRTNQAAGEEFRRYHGKLLSGRMFREKAGISYSYFLSLIRRKEVVPVCRNDANYSLFAEEDALRVAEEQKKSLNVMKMRQGVFDDQCQYTAEEAYEVVSRFKKGLSTQEVFLETRYHPVIVQTIWRDWVRMNEGMWLSADDLEAFNKLPLEGTFPITTAKELYDVMLLASKPRICGQCDERPASGTCLSCAKKAFYAAKRSSRMRKEGVPYEAEESTFEEGK